MKRNLQSYRIIIFALAYVLIAMSNNLIADDNWEVLPSGINSTINEVFVVPNHQEVIYAVGDMSLIMKSLDSGATWTQITSPITCQFKTCYFVTEEVGYIAGTGGSMIRTNDGGTTWTVQDSKGNSATTIYGITFFNNLEGIWVGTDGQIKYTMNGGTSWVTPYSGVFTEDLFSIININFSIAYAVGENGLIIKTTDKGNNWTILRDGTNSFNLKDIALNDNQTLLAVGTAGNTLVSYDFGDNWLYVNSGVTTDLHSCEISPNGAIMYASSDNGKIIRSDNKGIDWMDISPDTLFNVYSICFEQNLKGYIAGTLGFILMTDTGGDKDIIPSITVTSPTDGEVLVRDEQDTITWDASTISKFYLYYSTDDGTTWSFIDSLINNERQYIWTIPDIVSSTCKIKITDKSETVIDILAGTFTIFRPSLRLLSPNGGEQWQFGTNHDILWEAAVSTDIKLEYSIDNGENWMLISASETATFNKYTWTVPLNPTEEALIKISDPLNPKDYDISEASFKILGVKLNSFQDGGRYLYQSNQDVTWKSVGLNLVNIYYSIDNGANWLEIAENIDASLGTYSWIVPNTPTANALIKLVDPNNSVYFNISDLEFTITGVSLLSPAGGEAWQSGTTEFIKWQAASINMLKLQYKTDAENEWITIVSATDAATGQYEWTIPKTENSNAHIRIVDIDNSAVYDESQGFYILSDAGIIVTAPTTMDTLIIANTFNITWAAANVVNVNIYVSVNAGLTWEMLANNIPASSRTYAWTVPTTMQSSTECQIKITDADIDDIMGLSDEFFRIKGTFYKVPMLWDFKDMTSSNASIVLPASINPKIQDVALQNGDAIGVFYDYNGDYKCAGYGIWNGANLGITVWGNNTTTSEKDGYDLNEKYKLIVWDAQAGKEYNVSVTFSSGPDYFFDNNISIIDKFITHQTQRIFLPGGVWSIFSSNLVPVDSDITVIMDDVSFAMDYMKNEDGEIYDAQEDINNIGNWNNTHGYKIAMNDDAWLEFKGIPAIPNQNAKFISSGKWFIISYLPQMSLDIPWAMQSMENDTSLIMLKNSKGEIYYPHYGINNFTAFQVDGEDGKLNPGEGYMLAASKSDTLIFPVNATTVPDTLAIDTTSGNMIQLSNSLGSYKSVYYRSLAEATGVSSVLVVKVPNSYMGDEIAVCSKDGKVYGASSVIDGIAVITVWGNNIANDIIDGAIDYEDIYIKYFSFSNGLEYELEIQNIKDILSNNNLTEILKFEENLLFEISGIKGKIVSVNETNTIFNISLFPNPAKEYCKTAYNIKIHGSYSLEIYDISGNRVVSLFENKYLEVGEYIQNISLNKLTTGMYIVKLSNGKQNIIQKLQVNR